MKLKERLFSQVRLKQLANFLVLILSANILLESFSGNLLLASPKNNRFKAANLPVAGNSKDLLPVASFNSVWDKNSLQTELQKSTNLNNSPVATVTQSQDPAHIVTKSKVINSSNNLKKTPKTTKTGLLTVGTVGGACDPTVINICGNGLQCDPTAKTCLISVSNSCWNNPNSCAVGLSCDTSTHLCCAPIGGSCLGEIDCCVINSNMSGVDSSASCQPQNGQPITASTPGVCKLLPQADCSQAPNDCIFGAVCGTSSLNTQQTCCAPANGPCSLAGDCCAGLVCDDTAGVNQCVSCLAANHVCAGITNSCCEPLVCDPSGLCVMSAMSNCPVLGQQCASFSDCGGYNCNLVCDQVTQGCQLCGGLGSACIGDPTCCPTALNGVLKCDLINQTCCVPMAQNCTIDADCCSDAAGLVQCLPGTSKNSSSNNNGVDVGWNTGKTCTLTKIFSGQLCGASFNSTVEITGNANTPCQQDDPYGRPVSCNLVPASSASLASNLCTVKLLPAGSPCTELTATIAGVPVIYNYCDGWDSDHDQSEAACLVNPLDPAQGPVCCALAGGTCDPTHANNGNSDCCYSTLSCDSTLNQCVYPNSSTNFMLQVNQSPNNMQLHGLGASAQMDPYEAALIGVCVGLAVLLLWAGYKCRGSLNKLLNGIGEYVNLERQDIQNLKAVYPKNFAAKGCDPAARETFINALLDVMSERLVGWNSLVGKTGMNSADFKANLSAVAQLLIQQKLGEVLDLPGIEAGVAQTIQNYFKDLLPETLRTTLRSLSIPSMFIETIIAQAQPLATRKFAGLLTKVRAWVGTKMNSEVAVDPALTRRGLQAMNDLFKGVLKVMVANQTPGKPISDLVEQLSKAAAVLDKTIDNMGSADVLPGSAAGGPQRDAASTDILARAAVANTIESLFAQIETNSAMLRLRELYPVSLNFISQAFEADPVDFAKLYISFLAQVMLDNPGQKVTDVQMVAAIKNYSRGLIFSASAKLASDPTVTFVSILASDIVRNALVAAGGAVNTAAIILNFKSANPSMPLALKQLILKINGYPNAEALTQAEINGIDDEELETMLEVAVPLLNQVSIQAANGQTYPLMDLDGNVVSMINFSELTGLAAAWAS